MRFPCFHSLFTPAFVFSPKRTIYITFTPHPWLDGRRIFVSVLFRW